MCYENTGKRIRVYAAVLKAGGDSAAADAAVNKNSFTGSADEARIAGTSAGDGEEFCQKSNLRKI